MVVLGFVFCPTQLTIDKVVQWFGDQMLLYFWLVQTRLMLMVYLAFISLLPETLHALPSSRMPILQKRTNLQSVSEELVHLGDLGRDGEVDGPVANLNDESSNDLRVDLCLSACVLNIN